MHELSRYDMGRFSMNIDQIDRDIQVTKMIIEAQQEIVDSFKSIGKLKFPWVSLEERIALRKIRIQKLLKKKRELILEDLMNKYGIESDKIYMNPETGSVGTGAAWLIDFEEREDKEQDVESWGIGSLIRVKEHLGSWIEY